LLIGRNRTAKAHRLRIGIAWHIVNRGSRTGRCSMRAKPSSNRAFKAMNEGSKKPG
jgi:hypothetical protein